MVLSFLYSNFCAVNDFHKIGAIFTAIVCVNDTLSDILFAVSISEDAHYPHSLAFVVMFATSITFIVVPALFSLFQLSKQINVWKRVCDDLNAWFREHITILYIASMCMGSSFAAVELFNSNLFSLEIFDMGLSRIQLIEFKVKRMSLVFLEVCY